MSNYLSKLLLSLSVICIFGVVGCSQRSTSPMIARQSSENEEVVESSSDEDEMIESSSNEEEKEADFRSLYLPYQVYIAKDNKLNTLEEPYEPPTNIDDYVGSYESVVFTDEFDNQVNSEVEATNGKKIYLEIREDGYYTLYQEEIFLGINSENFRYIRSDDSYEVSKEQTDELSLETGVVTSEFNKVHLWPVSYFSNYSYDFELEWQYDIKGNRTTLAFTADLDDTDDTENPTVSDVPLYAMKETTIWLNNTSKSSGYITHSDGSDIIFSESVSNLKKVNNIPDYVKKSVFQQYYEWLENYTIDFKSKNDFFQTLRTEGVEVLGNKNLDDEMRNKKGYTSSGEKKEMIYIICPEDYSTDCYGYDGKKIYKGNLNEKTDTIEWEEISFSTQYIQSQISAH